METSGDVIWSVDSDARYTYINGPAVEAILGYKAEEMIGRPFTDFSHATSATALDAEFQALRETGSRLHVQGEYLHRTGRLVYLSITALALNDAEGIMDRERQVLSCCDGFQKRPAREARADQSL